MLVPGSVRDYICKADRDLPEGARPTVFHLKTLTAKETAQLEDGLSVFNKDGSMQVNSGSATLAILRMGLRGWTDVDAPFEADRDGAPADRSLDMLPPDVRRELADAITEGNRLDAEQEKN